MRIIVFDVPAESGGALSMLELFYEKFENDISNQYILILSVAYLKNKKNIEVINYPWIKKSWFHRLYFDYFIASKLCEKYNADHVLSLQNISIRNKHIEQTLLVQNAIPFSSCNFSLIIEPKLWIMKNIMTKMIYRSIKKTKYLIVQTEWMKEACINLLAIDSNRINVMDSSPNITILNQFKESRSSRRTFFYPSSGVTYKNHNIIVNACKHLVSNNIDDFKVIFTLNGNENAHIRKIYSQVKKFKLPILFVGELAKEKVFDYYTSSTLIFPSLIETVGLPLLEAKSTCTPILAANLPYAHEVLSNYPNVKFFDDHDSVELANIMKSCFEGGFI